MADISVYGFSTPDATFLKMKAVWDACDVAGIDPPQAVTAYFDGYKPEDAGFHTVIPVHRSDGDDTEYYDVTVADIPENVHTIRVRVDY